MRNRDTWIQPLASGPTRKLLQATLGISARTFPDAIHPRDEMYLYNLGLLHGDSDCAAVLYFFKGHQVATAIGDVERLLFADATDADATAGPLLDFGSGFGRATRFLRHRRSRVWVSDVVAEAVDFQRHYLEVHGFYSRQRPRDLRIDQRFRTVFASSLFSHLPEATFGPWLRCLFDLLEDGGWLAFSVLDRSLLTATADMSTAGLIFLPESESVVLDAAHYGTTYVTEDFVRSTLRSELGADVAVERLRRALCAHQDLYLVGRGQRAVRDEWRIDGFPAGELDAFELNGAGEARISGWAKASEIQDVRVFVRGEPFASADLGITEGAARWTATLDLRDVGLDDMVVVLARTLSGRESIVAIGTLRPYL